MKCVGSFGRNESVVLLGDLNVTVGNEMIENSGIKLARVNSILITKDKNQHGVPGRNESSKRLLEMCAGRSL